MEITPRPTYFIVRCTEDDIEAFNATHPARLPYDEITFGFTKGSGELLRVIPNKVRDGDAAWEALRDLALEFGRKELRR